jgi:predicted membrane channel-forming protein YqfA (hemolysin III family)
MVEHQAMDRIATYVIITALLAASAPPAFAYLDPASGSMLLQMIVGGVAGLALAVKMFWHRILGFFGVKPKNIDDDAAV